MFVNRFKSGVEVWNRRRSVCSWESFDLRWWSPNLQDLFGVAFIFFLLDSRSVQRGHHV